MNERVHILRQSIVKLTQMLAGKGVNVTQQGVTAYVRADPDGRPVQVNLPYLPDNATEELINAIQGFLDHEVAHILFSDFNVIGSIGDPALANMHNIVEDCRIERKMAERFQGSGENLAVTQRFFLDKYTKRKVEEAIAGGDDAQLIAVLTVPVIRALSGQAVMKDFVRDNEAYCKPILDKIKHLAPKLEKMDTCEDALELAKEVSTCLSGEPDETPKTGKKAAKKGGGGGGGSGGAGAGEGEDDESEHRSAAGEAEDDYERSISDGSKGSSGGSGSVGFDSVTWKAIEKEMANDFDSAVSKEITDSAVAAAADSDYLVFTTDKDVVEPLHIGSGYNPKMLTDLQDKTEHMVGPMQKDLERAISARSLAQWSTGRRSGKLHSANLARLAIKTPSGYDDRVFRKKYESSSKDVAVMLVVDISGSMMGSKVHTAVQGAYALASTLERIGIKSQVICFTTGPMAVSHAEMMAELAKLKAAGGKGYSRMESLYMPILKGFDERLGTEVKKRFGWMPNSGHMASNVDGESVLVAGRQLLARRETGKVMIVLSDGYPAASGSSSHLKAHLKKVVKDLAAAGINMIGIGIESDAVREFYPKSMVLHKVDELPVAVMKTLRGLIVTDAPPSFM